ncbi:AGAP011020-PA-like protein [Anopheles sinensis]|uniref:AGAP011020-PA-like protein n=1 Tax=Anopheles sinensis TaxID=74873 RepID=A0A084W987_ANOSI|nr:AGAP011020-PA-like protein [Anopheles sinensis]
MAAMRDFNDIRMLVDYTVRALNGTIQNKIFSRSIEFCQFLRRPNMDRMMKMFYITINRTSRLPNRCPIGKGQRSDLRFLPATMPVPSFFPETNFLANVNFYTGLRQEPILESRWYGGLKKIHG